MVAERKRVRKGTSERGDIESEFWLLRLPCFFALFLSLCM